MKVIGFAAFFAVAAQTALAQDCPMADRSYTLKYQTWLSTKMYFNPDCTEAVQNYKGNITRHQVTWDGKYYRIADTEGAYWLVNAKGTLAHFYTGESRVVLKMRPNKRD